MRLSKSKMRVREQFWKDISGDRGASQHRVRGVCETCSGSNDVGIRQPERHRSQRAIVAGDLRESVVLCCASSCVHYVPLHSMTNSGSVKSW